VDLNQDMLDGVISG